MTDLLRHAQLRRRATPEQIGRGGGHDGHVRPKCSERIADIRHRKIAEMRIDQVGMMSSLSQQQLRNSQLKRQMWRLAAEVDAAVKTPVRIDERDLHTATFCNAPPEALRATRP